MNAVGVIVVLVLGILLLSVPKKWAPLPLLAGCCFITMGQSVEFGPINLQAYRMLIFVGLLRVVMRGERIAGDAGTTDRLIICWACWMFFASLFHEFIPGSGPLFTLGVVFNITAIYYLSRVWCNDVEAITALVGCIAFVLAPIAAEMIYEKLAGKNLFSVFGGLGQVFIRDGEIRARGSFRHPILAGTVGATCLPLMIGIWNRHRVSAIVGIIACLAMVGASQSSGPVVSLGVGLAVVAAWKFRRHVKRLCWSCVVAYILVEMISNRPAYHVVVTRLDFTGSSTAHYRCRVIDVAVENFSQWVAVGTDHTRNWIPGGIGSVVGDGRHMDITNYYVAMGVMGGFLALCLVVGMIFVGIRNVVIFVNERDNNHTIGDKFIVWCFGAALFTHAISAISVAYFDQSQTFFWMTLGITTSLTLAMTRTEENSEHQSSKDGFEERDWVTPQERLATYMALDQK